MEKASFRKHAIGRLKSISRSKRKTYDHKINRLLLDRIEELGAKSVMAYIPMGMEVDIVPLINTLRRRGVEVYVPFMEGASFRLVKYRLPLKKKKYGVREPNFSNNFRNKKIDLAIVPIVGTDRTLRRIGFGKGMYDRFFAHSSIEFDYIVFVQRVLVQYRGVITDDWDVSADEIVCAV